MRRMKAAPPAPIYGEPRFAPISPIANEHSVKKGGGGEEESGRVTSASQICFISGTAVLQQKPNLSFGIGVFLEKKKKKTKKKIIKKPSQLGKKKRNKTL